jgi:hypothetical protein
MKISKSNLQDACARLGINSETADRLWSELEKENTSKFDIEHLAYYFGSFIVMSAMGWFMTQAWGDGDGIGISVLGSIYFLVFIFVARRLWFRKHLVVPGGLLFTLAVWMVPLVVFGIEKYTGLWPQETQTSFHDYHVWVRGSWLAMEMATIVTGAVVLWYIRFPFLTFPVAFSLWYLSMDLTPMIYGADDFSWEQRQLVSVWFGILTLIGVYFIDRKTKEDYAFWGYLFGLMAFWGGLSSMNSDSELNKLLYCLINMFLILVSVVIQRRVFLVFGSIGIFAYLGHLAFRVFKDSMLFPVALSLLGIAIIYLGIVYNRNKLKIEEAVRNSLPDALLKLNPNSKRA